MRCRHKDHDWKRVGTVIGWMVVYDYDKFSRSSYCYAGSDDASKSLIRSGMFENEKTRLITDLLKSGDRKNLVLDIGCGIGWYANLASSIGYTVKAYDDIEENLQLVKENAPKAVGIVTDFKKPIKHCKFSVKDIEICIINKNEALSLAFISDLLLEKMIKNLIVKVEDQNMLDGIVKYGFKVFDLNGEVNYQAGIKWLQRN